MTREEALRKARGYLYDVLDMEEADDIIEALRQTDKIKALGEDMRICRKSIKDEKVLIGFNMAIAICNKYLGESEK